MAEIAETIVKRTSPEFRKETEKQNKSILKSISKGIINVASAPGRAVNVGTIQRTPQTILSKEQRMLNALFNDKNQFWGNGEPVQINNTLTSGNGLIKTGSGNATRRLFLP